MKLQYQNRTGLSHEHAIVIQPPHQWCRLTVPAREALERAGARISREPADDTGVCTYTIELFDSVPPGLVVVQIVGTRHTGIRLSHEPPYPGEICVDYWQQLDFTPCPQCGAPLVWYEAGYVPGYRVCSRPPHHHVAGADD